MGVDGWYIGEAWIETERLEDGEIEGQRDRDIGR